jgi:hypothetical protein
LIRELPLLLSHKCDLLHILSLLLLSPLYQHTEVFFGSLQFLGEVDLPLCELLVLQLDLLQLVLHLAVLINHQTSLVLHIFNLV